VRTYHPEQRPLRYAFVDGIDVRDARVHNYPRRWNAALSQNLLVIRRNRRSLTRSAALGPHPALVQGGRRSYVRSLRQPIPDAFLILIVAQFSP
jgi:hypothetical protein